MGLDMNLKRGKRIPKKSMKDIMNISRDMENDEKMFAKYSEYVFSLEDVAYWRKANAIHKWFVDNIQDGNDDCDIYEVSREKLEELLKTCKEVLKSLKLVPGKVLYSSSFEKDENGELKKVNHYKDGLVIADTFLAEKLLPCTNGFFFGSVEYNEWYYKDIEETIKILKKVLKETDFDNYYVAYQSSW